MDREAWQRQREQQVHAQTDAHLARAEAQPAWRRFVKATLTLGGIWPTLSGVVLAVGHRHLDGVAFTSVLLGAGVLIVIVAYTIAPGPLLRFWIRSGIPGSDPGESRKTIIP